MGRTLYNVVKFSDPKKKTTTTTKTVKKESEILNLGKFG